MMEFQKKEIVRLYNAGELRQKDLALMFHTSQQHISRIIREINKDRKYIQKHSRSKRQITWIETEKLVIEHIRKYNNVEKILWKKNRVQIKCKICRKNLTITFSHFLQSTNHFCSRKCLAENRKVYLVCKNCNKKVLANGRRFFCNSKCHTSWRKNPQKSQEATPSSL